MLNDDDYFDTSDMTSKKPWPVPDLDPRVYEEHRIPEAKLKEVEEMLNTLQKEKSVKGPPTPVPTFGTERVEDAEADTRPAPLMENGSRHTARGACPCQANG